MKLSDKIKTNLMSLSLATMSLVTPVMAEGEAGLGEGTLSEVTTAFDPVIKRISPIINGGLNLAAVALAIYAVVRACFGYYQYFTEDNPNEKKNKLKGANSYMFGAAIAVCLVLIVNVLLSAMGIGIFKFK